MHDNGRILGCLDENDPVVLEFYFHIGDRGRQHVSVSTQAFQAAAQGRAGEPGMPENIEVARLRASPHLHPELAVVRDVDAGVPELGHLRQGHPRAGALEFRGIDFGLLERGDGVDAVLLPHRLTDQPRDRRQCRGFVQHEPP